MKTSVKTQRTSFLTKLVILAILIATATALLELHTQLQTAQQDRDTLSIQLAAQMQVNADLADAVENSDDSARQADIAREKFGLVVPGEQVIYFTD